MGQDKTEMWTPTHREIVISKITHLTQVAGNVEESRQLALGARPFREFPFLFFFFFLFVYWKFPQMTLLCFYSDNRINIKTKPNQPRDHEQHEEVRPWSSLGRWVSQKEFQLLEAGKHQVVPVQSPWKNGYPNPMRVCPCLKVSTVECCLWPLPFHTEARKKWSDQRNLPSVSSCFVPFSPYKTIETHEVTEYEIIRFNHFMLQMKLQRDMKQRPSDYEKVCTGKTHLLLFTVGFSASITSTLIHFAIFVGETVKYLIRK